MKIITFDKIGNEQIITLKKKSIKSILKGLKGFSVTCNSWER